MNYFGLSTAGNGTSFGNVEICDVTLRDGEQAPGVVFGADEKSEIATKLDAIGVEMIEAGFPAVSAKEKATVKTIANLGLDAKICCLSRAIFHDVDEALDCDVDVVGLFMATSDLHLKYKYHRSFDEMLECALSTLEYAKEHDLIVRFAAEDATRTDPKVLKHFFMEGEKHRADYLSIADTVGALRPASCYDLVTSIKKVVSVPLCIHCHNDLGMAVANTITAAEAGAYQLHTTVNGIGERVGNTPLEELLVALRLQFGIDKYDLAKLTDLSKIVERDSRLRLPKNKPIVGLNAFSHESGIHVAAVLEEPETYELFSPQLVGNKRRIVIGKHTGKKALQYVIAELGYRPTRDELCEILDDVKRVCETKKSVSQEELEDIIRSIMYR
ncbi:MAG TPA: homocitrate synthase family protein [Candidatus Acidoferrales bacterium]|nr:homocitrate synthase family protein [Candidatus Acidoferrales bacterium]